MSAGAARGGEATLRGLAPIAEKMGMTADELFTKLHEEIRAQLANATKPCGCGPLEPCKSHLGAGDLQDWESRARAAEAKLADLKRIHDREWHALWVLVRQAGGSVFIPEGHLSRVPSLASLGMALEPGGMRINASEEA